MLSVQHAIYFALRAEATNDAGDAIEALRLVTARDRILGRMQPSELEVYWAWVAEVIAVVDITQARAPRASRFAS